MTGSGFKWSGGAMDPLRCKALTEQIEGVVQCTLGIGHEGPHMHARRTWEDKPERLRDKQGDIWTPGPDGLLHSHETRPFPREYVERKWGPLTKERT